VPLHLAHEPRAAPGAVAIAHGQLIAGLSIACADRHRVPAPRAWRIVSAICDRLRPGSTELDTAGYGLGLPLGLVRRAPSLVHHRAVRGVHRAAERSSEAEGVAVLHPVEDDLVSFYEIVGVQAQVRGTRMADELVRQPGAQST
jgi:hypothetical protein